MSTKHTINNHTTPGDRRTAFTAMLAGKTTAQAATGNCLSAEDLASLIEASVGDADQEKYFAHLAACDSCYHQWLELSRVVADQQKKKTVIPLITPGRLAWAGSFLAAAASIVLFLNIQQDTGAPVLMESSAVQTSTQSDGIAEKMDSKLDSAADAQAEVESFSIEDSVPQVEAGTPPPAVPNSAAVPVKKSKNFRLRSVDSEYAEEEATQVRPIAQSMSAAAPAEIPTPVSAWMDNTAAACRKVVQGQHIGRHFWQQQVEAGKEFFAADRTSQERVFRSPGEREQVQLQVQALALLLEDPGVSLPVCRMLLNPAGNPGDR